MLKAAASLGDDQQGWPYCQLQTTSDEPQTTPTAICWDVQVFPVPGVPVMSTFGPSGPPIVCPTVTFDTVRRRVPAVALGPLSRVELVCTPTHGTVDFAGLRDLQKLEGMPALN